MKRGRVQCTMLLVLQTLLFATLFSAILSQRADFPVPDSNNQANRRFSLSTEAPLTSAINELSPDSIPYISLLLRHITRVEEAVLKSIRRDRLIPEAVIQPCNPMISRGYRSSIFRTFGFWGFAEPAWECGSDVSGVAAEPGERPGYTLNDLYEAMFYHKAMIKARVSEIVTRLIDNFTRPEVPFNFSYTTTSTECVMTQACMYREGEFWREGIGIHSHGRDDHVRDGNRNSIIEVFRVVNGVLGDNLLFRLPVYDNGAIERVFLDNTTTMIQSFLGTPNPSCFRQIPIEDNPAVIEAMDRLDHFAQQAEDAVTKSNLAILSLPLGLNLIPVALFADVSTRAMLAYIILSDLLTVIPLAIKGVELVTIRNSRFRSVVTRVSSPGFRNATVPFAAGGEIWGAECRVKEELGRIGEILISVSVVFLVVGLIGEFVARYFVKRRLGKQQQQQVLSSQSGSWRWSWSESDETLLTTETDVSAVMVEKRYALGSTLQEG